MMPENGTTSHFGLTTWDDTDAGVRCYIQWSVPYGKAAAISCVRVSP